MFLVSDLGFTDGSAGARPICSLSLMIIIDDHSRLICGYRFGFAEDAVRLGAGLQRALASRGVPASVYAIADLRSSMPGFCGHARNSECALFIRLRTGPRAGVRSSGSSAQCVNSFSSRSPIPVPRI